MEQRDEQVNALLESLIADLTPTGLRPEVGVFDLAHRRWIAGNRQDDQPPPGFGNDGYVLALAGREHLLSETSDAGTPPDLLLGLIEEVREWAMDELGHGWPELYDDAGGFLAVLEPIDDSGRLVWAAGEHRVFVGELASVPVAVPPRWDGIRI